MRILYLAPHWALRLNQSGGAGTHMRGTIKAFRDWGHQVLPVVGGDVIYGESVRETRSDASSLKSASVSRLLQPCRSTYREFRQVGRDLVLASRAHQLITAFRPDVIYERSWLWSCLGTVLAVRRGIPHFLETSGCVAEISKQSGNNFTIALANLFERWKMSRADIVSVEAESAVSFVSSKFGISTKKVVAKPLGIDPTAYVADVQLVDAIRERFALRGKVVAGFVGSFQSYHGLRYLVEAARLLNKEYAQDMVVLVVGWGPDGEAMAKASSDVQNIIWVGAVDRQEVGAYLSCMDVGIVPDSEAHMFPIKTLEYGLYRVCPIVPNYRAFESLVVNGETGITFPARSATGLAVAMKSAISNMRRTRSMGNAFSNQIKSQMTWTRVVEPVLAAMKLHIKSRTQLA